MDTVLQTTVTLASLSSPVRAVDDPYSDRVRCDHPGQCDGEALGVALTELADDAGRGRIVALVEPGVADGLQDAGYRVDGVLPSFYGGSEDCVVMGSAPDPDRAHLANPREVAAVDDLLDEAPAARPRAPVTTRRAAPSDASAIANLLGGTFAEYPTPSHDPEYVREQLTGGTPFRVVERAGAVVACASADLVRGARTAELTDCATRPDHRGQGYMQFILSGLVDDVGALGYPTVFTLARARIAGVNLAFQRLGFEKRGTMAQSCRIGDGLEDMNIWSRATALV